MSPSEFDLRSALRDGEDDGGLDVDRVVSDARARRSQRRTRILSTAAAVIVVAGAAIGATALRGGGDGGHSQAGVRDGSGHPSSTGPASSGTGPDLAGPGATEQGPTDQGPTDQGKPADPAAACPATFPHTLLPGGGSPGQFGSSGPLFAEPAATVVVCGYGATAAAGAPLVLTGSDATALTSSLENAPKTRQAKVCPDIATGEEHNFAIIARAADGDTMKTVTASLTLPACNQLVTNGTAVRYGWAPPAGLRSRLLALSPSTLPAGTDSSGENGSPVH